MEVKLACNFILDLDSRVKWMFVRFFSLTSLFENSVKFGILTGKIQIKFLSLA